jgi:hypothetical protein
MGLFDSIRRVVGGSEPTPDVEDDANSELVDLHNADVEQLQEQAEAVADATDDLDFSLASLARLDAAIDQWYDMTVPTADESHIYPVDAVRLGCYLGEVLARVFDGTWSLDPLGVVITGPDGRRTVAVFDVAVQSMTEGSVFGGVAALVASEVGFADVSGDSADSGADIDDQETLVSDETEATETPDTATEAETTMESELSDPDENVSPEHGIEPDITGDTVSADTQTGMDDTDEAAEDTASDVFEDELGDDGLDEIPEQTEPADTQPDPVATLSTPEKPMFEAVDDTDIPTPSVPIQDVEDEDTDPAAVEDNVPTGEPSDEESEIELTEFDAATGTVSPGTTELDRPVEFDAATQSAPSGTLSESDTDNAGSSSVAAESGSQSTDRSSGPSSEQRALIGSLPRTIDGSQPAIDWELHTELSVTPADAPSEMRDEKAIPRFESDGSVFTRDPRVVPQFGPSARAGPVFPQFAPAVDIQDRIGLVLPRFEDIGTRSETASRVVPRFESTDRQVGTDGWRLPLFRSPGSTHTSDERVVPTFEQSMDNRRRSKRTIPVFVPAEQHRDPDRRIRPRFEPGEIPLQQPVAHDRAATADRSSTTVDDSEPTQSDWSERPDPVPVGTDETGLLDERDEPTLTVADTTDDGRSDHAVAADTLVETWTEYEFDYTPASLRSLDALVANEWPTDRFVDATYGSDETYDDAAFTGVVFEVGSYFGEVLLRELNGEWRDETDTDAVVVDSPEGKLAVPVFRIAATSFRQQPVFTRSYEALRDDLALSD